MLPGMLPGSWEIIEAVALIRELEIALSDVGLHVALNGGVLTKGGDRKDLDLIIYPDKAPVEWDEVMNSLDQCLKTCNISRTEQRNQYNYVDCKLVFRCEHPKGRIDLFLMQ